MIRPPPLHPGPHRPRADGGKPAHRGRRRLPPRPRPRTRRRPRPLRSRHGGRGLGTSGDRELPRRHRGRRPPDLPGAARSRAASRWGVARRAAGAERNVGPPRSPRPRLRRPLRPRGGTAGRPRPGPALSLAARRGMDALPRPHRPLRKSEAAGRGRGTPRRAPIGDAARERPGFSSIDSLGAYLTFGPGAARTDADRNCLSNIRPEGLPPAQAAAKLAALLAASAERKVSGVALKDLEEPSLEG